MRILIVGAGVVGSNLAEELSRAGHAVSIVDRDPALIRRIEDRMDALAVTGNAGRPSVLRRAGIESAQMVIAVTDSDEVNVVVGMLASRFGARGRGGNGGGAARNGRRGAGRERIVIVRVRHDELGEGGPVPASALGIDQVINPERLIRENLLRTLEIPGALEVATFAGERVVLVTFAIEEGAPIAGKRLAEIRELAEMDAFLVVAIFRGESALVPRGDDDVRVGDHIAVIGLADTLSLFLPLVAQRAQRPERVVIYGAEMVGEDLAADLEGRVERLVLIEPRQELAERAAARLRRTLVLAGEATDPEVVEEAALDGCDFFAALSRDDEKNLLSALLARRHRARRVAVMCQEPDYVQVLTSIGMDVVINPRLVAAGEILRHVRRGQIHTVTRLKESEAEVIELEPVEGSIVTRFDLKDLDFPAGSIIGAVLRDGDVIIPSGDFRIAAGDTVVVFALPDAIPPIERLFSRARRGLSGLLRG